MEHEHFLKVTCPYFIRGGRSKDNYTIICEGVIGTERQVFNTRKKRRIYIEKHCEKMGTGCILCEYKNRGA